TADSGLRSDGWVGSLSLTPNFGKNQLSLPASGKTAGPSPIRANGLPRLGPHVRTGVLDLLGKTPVEQGQQKQSFTPPSRPGAPWRSRLCSTLSRAAPTI